MNEEWFSHWFDSPYYHTLYHQRNDDDARNFIDNLVAYLKPEPGAPILDLACGRGRHALYLSKLGFNVTGLDFSMSNIDFASQLESDHLSFFQHDMRLPYRINYYQYIFNFFTSFGYFDRFEEHLSSLENIYQGLKPGGVFVLDFMNSHLERERLVEDEQRVVDGLIFNIQRWMDEEHIFKTICFQVEDKSYVFRENVRSFRMEELEDMLKAIGFERMLFFGNYKMDPFVVEHSERLILLAHKPNLTLA